MSRLDFLGRGATTPLRRAGGTDFLFASGPPLIRSAIRQIIGTQPGELRWRPTFGVLLEPFRHKANDEDLTVELRANVDSALRRFEPRMELKGVEVDRNGSKLVIRVRWLPVAVDNPTSQVTLNPQITEVEI